MIINCIICGKPKQIFGKYQIKILKTCGAKDCIRQYRSRFYKWTPARKKRHSEMAIQKGYGKWLIGKTTSQKQKSKAKANFLKEKNPRWQPIGSRHTIKYKTYWVIKIAEHKWQKEHIFLMEKMIGRKLRKYEIVHHIDRNGLNNSKENLQLMTKREHRHLHYPKGSHWGNNK